MNGSAHRLLTGPWERLRGPAAAVRERVFICEQGIPASLEWDQEDAACLHAVVVSEPGARALGTARLTPDGRIGRLAVIPEERRRGLGTELVLALLAAGRAAGHRELRLAAQLRVTGFYERLGFEGYGDVFDDAGIPHRWMRRAEGRD